MKPIIELRITDRLKDMTKRQMRGVSRAVRSTAYWMEREIKQSMSGPKSGKRYERFGLRRRKRKDGSIKYSRVRKRAHVASAPGEPPAKDTGRLMNSIGVRMAGPYTAFVGSRGVRYAAGLEFGTFRVQARPYVRPVAQRAQTALTARLEKIMARETGG